MFDQFPKRCHCHYPHEQWGEAKFIKDLCIVRVTCLKCGQVSLSIEGGREHWSNISFTQWPRYFWQRRSKWLDIGWYRYVLETDSIRKDAGFDIGVILRTWRCRAAGHPHKINVRASWNGLEPIYYCSNCYEEVE